MMEAVHDYREGNEAEPDRNDPIMRPFPFAITTTEPTMTEPTTFNPEEPSTVHAFFERISNTIVDASKLAKDVALLRSEVDSLRHEVDVYRQHNARLDEEVYRLRTEREDQRRTIVELQMELDGHIREVGDLKASRDAINQELTCEKGNVAFLNGRFQDAAKDRDNAQFKVMELEDSVKRLEADLKSHMQRADAAEGALNTIRNVLSPPLTLA
jgi:chromosome segregation ATPase